MNTTLRNLSPSYQSQRSAGCAPMGTSALFTSLKILCICNWDQKRGKETISWEQENKTTKNNADPEFEDLPPDLVFRTERPDAVDLCDRRRSEQVPVPVARQHPLRESQQMDALLLVFMKVA